jgi:hypothetical protein
MKLLDFRRNLGIKNEQNRTIVEAQLAPKPIPACTKLELVATESRLRAAAKYIETYPAVDVKF